MLEECGGNRPQESLKCWVRSVITVPKMVVITFGCKEKNEEDGLWGQLEKEVGEEGPHSWATYDGPETGRRILIEYPSESQSHHFAK